MGTTSKRPSPLSEDGSWGPQTESAARAFQTDVTVMGLHNLQADGIVGPQTGEAILEEGNPYYTGNGHSTSAYCYGYILSEW
ncbi:peptidoglycan-binding protein [Streptacidiphilus sp. PB12-B1b]|uniref:peptidoglycan-binding domain-containing protein n=1 Tax=Streptacidiphilus sp. PB12-B1b TaxID=2705012 RepID=UPI001CDC4FBE|nr:peptidoglycan-binding domain-containing protein [Streptacidiphilus sp. PB12-B1b]